MQIYALSAAIPFQNMSFPGPDVEIQLVFQRMIFLVNLLQMRRCQVQIDLRRIDTLMADKELDLPDVRPGIEKMCRKAVPDNMRRNLPEEFEAFNMSFRKPDAFSHVPQNLLQSMRRESHAV